MTRARRTQIGDYADKLRSGLMGSALPVDVEALVTRLGGTVVESAALEHEAEIRRSGERAFVITIRPWEARTRRRFSIAHELGHLFLHMGYLTPRWQRVTTWVDTMRRAGVSEEENEAHEFAGALLMPAADFRRVARENLDGDTYRLGPIAEEFAVSVDAARTRGRWLNVFTWS